MAEHWCQCLLHSVATRAHRLKTVRLAADPQKRKQTLVRCLRKMVVSAAVPIGASPLQAKSGNERGRTARAMTSQTTPRQYVARRCSCRLFLCSSVSVTEPSAKGCARVADRSVVYTRYECA